MHRTSASAHAGRSGAPLVLVGIGASMVALATAPALVPADYSWGVEHHE